MEPAGCGEILLCHQGRPLRGGLRPSLGFDEWLQGWGNVADHSIRRLRRIGKRDQRPDRKGPHLRDRVLRSDRCGSESILGHAEIQLQVVKGKGKGTASWQSLSSFRVRAARLAG